MKAIPLLLAVAACQSADVPPAPAAACSVTVRFGSYAMGIDTAAAAEIDTILAGNANVKSVTRSAWGREGEYTLCVATRDATGAVRLMKQLAAVLPQSPKGPISVEGIGQRIDAPAR